MTRPNQNVPEVSVIVPCHNEQDNLRELYNRLIEFLPTGYAVEIIFVDDGSNDATAQVMEQLAGIDERVRMIILSRNFGHQQALKAGLDHARGRCVISLDADLQHPPSLIPKLIAEWKNGFEVVYTIRREDPSLPWSKRIASRFFYWISNKLASVEIPHGAADFRLLDRKVVDVLKQCQESFLFLRGLVAWAGFRQKAVEYTPAERFAGKTKYSFSKMLRFALAGITSFSIRPLQLSFVLGIIIASLAFLYGMYAILIYLFTDRAVSGWASTLTSVLFIGGVQLVMTGILGEYIGKMFIENKKRPTYIIRYSNFGDV